MTTRVTGPKQFKAVLIALTLMMVLVQVAMAQDKVTPPEVEVKATFGGAAFDETSHGVAGGSARFYFTRRLSVEPEFLYLWHDDHDRDYIFQPNLAVDLTDPRGRIVPYLIGGAGVIRHTGSFSTFDFSGPTPVFTTIDTSSTSWTASAGAGVKVFVTDRLFVSPEARLGREPFLRATISVGYVFKGRKRN